MGNTNVALMGNKLMENTLSMGNTNVALVENVFEYIKFLYAIFSRTCKNNYIPPRKEINVMF
jgi:hypothetical protein